MVYDTQRTSTIIGYYSMFKGLRKQLSYGAPHISMNHGNLQGAVPNHCIASGVLNLGRALALSPELNNGPMVGR